MKREEYLTSIYYDPKHPASFSSARKLYKAVRQAGKFVISQSKIQKWLQGQDTYTMHRPSLRKFKRNKVIVDGIDSQWDADLMDMSYVAEHNDGSRYVLMAIDVFSRYAWAVPIATKKAEDVLRGMRQLLSTGRTPNAIRTDKGKEFTSAKMSRFFKDRNILHTVTQNEVKANYVERLIKTIKGRLSKYFQEKNTFSYLNVLSDVIDSYNHTYHRSIKKTPNSVNENNQFDLWQQLYIEPHVKLPRDKKRKKSKRKKKKKSPFKYKINDTVRVSYLRNIFTREYDNRWSGEIFTVTHRLLRNGIPVYNVKDYAGDQIRGTFYEQELQGVDFDPDKTFKIEKVLKTKGRGKNKSYLVRWQHWPPKYDSWVADLTLL